MIFKEDRKGKRDHEGWGKRIESDCGRQVSWGVRWGLALESGKKGSYRGRRKMER